MFIAKFTLNRETRGNSPYVKMGCSKMRTICSKIERLLNSQFIYLFIFFITFDSRDRTIV